MKNYQYNRGAAIITAVLLLVVISATIAIGMSSPVLREYVASRDFTKSKEAYYLSESGLEDAAYRLKKGLTIDSQEILTLGGNIATTTVTTVNLSKKTVDSVGTVTADARRATLSLTTATGESFNYGVQAGGYGAVMETGATINGNLFSVGPVCGGGSAGTGCHTTIAPSYRGGGKVTSQSSSPINVTASPSAQADDLVILIGSTDSSTGTFTWPAGFTENATTITSTANGQVMRFATKIATTTEPASYSVAHSPASTATGVAVVIYSGVSAATPLDVTPTANVVNTLSSSPWSVVATGLPSGTTNRMIVDISGIDNATSREITTSGQSGSPGTWSRRINTGTTSGKANIGVYDAVDVAGTFTGTATTPYEGSGTTGGKMAFLLALRPANSLWGNSASGISTITGTVISGGPSGLNGWINRIQNNLSASMYAGTIKDSVIAGTPYCITNNGSNPAGCTTLLAQSDPGLPISDAEVALWQAGATAGGVDPCNSWETKTISTSATIGPWKYGCYLTFAGPTNSDPAITITLQGPIWATGDIRITGKVNVRVDPSYTGQSIAIIADKQGNTYDDEFHSSIFVNNGYPVTFTGATGGNSWITLISESSLLKNYDEIWNPAINVGSNVSGDVVLYSNRGLIWLGSSSSVAAIAGYGLKISSGGVVNYSIGLQNTLFISGPSGSWSAQDWKSGQ